LTLSVTAHGIVPTGRALRRSDAKCGDVVFVTGTIGDAAGGLRILQSANPGAENPGSNEQVLVARLNRPQARVSAGIALRDLASACIDISDGLLADLGHVATSSKLGIEIGEDCLPTSAALQECFDAGTCRDLQLFGGDDYELAFAIAEAKVDSMRATMEKLGCRVSRIGRVIEESGIHVLDRDGQRRETSNKGWDHFR
jgi:thiamine-monophosphate kinase